MNKFAFAAALAALVSTPAMADDNAKSGARIEGRLTYETPTVSSLVNNNDIFKIGSAVAYGAEAGYDFKVGSSVVVGPYVNFEKSSVKSSDGLNTIKVKDNFAAGVHLGYALSEKGQVYIKAGYAKLRIAGRIAPAPGNIVAFAGSGSGAQGAIGYEHSFSKNIYGRLEFGYGDNGQIVGLNIQRRHAGIAIGARF